MEARTAIIYGEVLATGEDHVITPITDNEKSPPGLPLISCHKIGPEPLWTESWLLMKGIFSGIVIFASDPMKTGRAGVLVAVVVVVVVIVVEVVEEVVLVLVEVTNDWWVEEVEKLEKVDVIGVDIRVVTNAVVVSVLEE